MRCRTSSSQSNFFLIYCIICKGITFLIQGRVHREQLRCFECLPHAPQGGGLRCIKTLKKLTSRNRVPRVLEQNSRGALCPNKVGPQGTEALAGLKSAPSLTSFAVNLNFNNVGDAGVRALAAFAECPALTSLRPAPHWTPPHSPAHVSQAVEVNLPLPPKVVSACWGQQWTPLFEAFSHETRWPL